MLFVESLLNLSLTGLNHFGYWIIFLMAILEATPIFGLFVPGQTLIIIAGFFVKLNFLNLYFVIFFAAFGAILGDFIGYLLGKHYGYSFLMKYRRFFLFKEKSLEKMKKLMNNHSGKTLILGRFNSLTRAIVPFIAGISDVPFNKFLIYNVFGGVSWAISFVLLGYIFGESCELIVRFMGKFILIAIILSIFFVYSYEFLNKRKHIFRKYHIYILTLNLLSLYTFSKILDDVVRGEVIVGLDYWLNKNIVFLWNPLLTKIMIFITNIMSVKFLLFLLICLFAFFTYKKKWYFSLLLIFSVFGGLLIENLLKIIIRRTRPDNALINVSGYSLPSGHATLSIIFFLLMIYAFKGDIKHKFLKMGFIFVNILLFLLIGFSRIYLNVHWFSDVLAGFSLGLFWLTFLVLIFKIFIVLSRKNYWFFKKKSGNLIKEKLRLFFKT